MPAHILIAEDSSTQAQRLQYILERQGYQVSIADNGRLALEMALQIKPSLIISDVVMPEMDGYELCRQIKASAETRDLPVILVTSMSSPEDVILGLECGADNFIIKPYEERYLLSRVQYVLVNREFHHSPEASMGVEVYFNSKRHYITAGRLQILNLLLSTYEAAVQRNDELARSQQALEARSAELTAANRFLDSIIENIPTMVFVKETDSFRHTCFNRAGEDLTGYPREAVLGKTVFDLFPPEQAEFFHRKDLDAVTSGVIHDIHEESIRTADGSHRILHTKKVPILDQYGHPTHLLGISEDVTEQRAMENEIRRLNKILEQRAERLEAINEEKQEALNYLSLFDTLTGLPNRQLFLERATQSLQSVARTGAKLAVVVVDIRRLGMINDSFGTCGGDQALKLIAERLSHDTAATCARIGSNTFAMTLLNLSEDGQVAAALNRHVLAPFRRPFLIADQELTVSIRCGVALFPNDGEAMDQLIGNAEAALKKAKLSNNEYLFYTPDLNARVSEQLILESQLHKAIANQEFVLHYQPKVAAGSSKLIGFEALLRWRSPDRGMVTPIDFIPLLEETGMILEVGRWVLQQAAADYREWRNMGLKLVPIAVNISVTQLRQADFAEAIASAVSGMNGEEAAAIDLEITESVLMEDIDRTIPSLQKLRDAGFHIAIDDFGTGYSSFSYLTKIPLDSIKIDRSFVKDMTTNASQKTVVSTIILLAHALGLRVIAEGVETEDQREQLLSIGCDEIQGYLYGKPMPAADVIRLLACL
jgi:diguanylate cyclase (GGDEF)-like protein/PAS domain S-box-containing protein